MAVNILLLLQTGDMSCEIFILKWIFDLLGHWSLLDGSPSLPAIGAFMLEIFFPVEKTRC